jgi:hypothetical protein
MIAALDEIPRAAEPCDPALDWRPVRDHLGITAFAVLASGRHPARRSACRRGRRGSSR